MIDLVGSGDGSDGLVVFVRGGELIVADLTRATVTYGPVPLSAGYGGAVLALLQAGGVDALLYNGTVGAASTPLRAFRGPAVFPFAGARADAAGEETYLPAAYQGWPRLWNPRLQQAPAGAMGTLWATAESEGFVITHDGTAWADVPLPAGATGLPSVDAGADGTVFAGSGTALYQLDSGGAAPAWRPLASTPGTVAQVAVGDAGHVWVRSHDSSVHRYGGGSGGTFSAVDLGGGAVAHLAANADGTLWHCDGAGADAFRLISEGSRPSDALGVAGGAAVQKVASTGFGTGLVLAQQGGAPQLYAYTSPYLFKTGAQYAATHAGTLDVGAGAVLLSGADYSVSPPAGFLAALDVQTGQERWRRETGALTFTNPVYDPALQVAYIAGTDGIVSALDVHTGETLWEYQTNSLVDAAPAFAGGQLCFGDRAGVVHLLDTREALQAGGNGQAPTPVWVSHLPVNAGFAVARLATPLIAADAVYVQAWLRSIQSPSGYISSPSRLDLATGTSIWMRQRPGITGLTSTDDIALGPPVAGQALFTVGTARTAFPAVVFNEVDHLRATPVDSPPVTGDSELAIPTPSATFSSDLTASEGRLYAGDSLGNVYVLDPAAPGTLGAPDVDRSRPTPTAAPTPTPQPPAWAILARTQGAGSVLPPPVVMGPPGSETVIFGGFDDAVQQLHFFAPATDALTTLGTGQTSISLLSRDLSSGVLYAAGARPVGDGLAQVFAIRADAAASDLAAFIVESQLMQDFDDPSGGPGAGAAVKVARYQTHLTVVDDLKQPRAQETVKLWADQATSVVVDGTAYAIDATTPATVQTGADGALVIVSEAADLFAPRLTAWAAFMDPAERLVISPDQEFHGRLATVVADPGSDDPNQINLSTTTDYGNTPLFSDQEQTQAAGVASGVKQLCGAVGLGAPGGAAGPALTAGAPLGAGPVNPHKYVAYPGELPGAAYAPSSQPAPRPLAVVTPFGLSLDTTGALNTHAPAEATLLLDQLEGAPPRLPPQGLLGASGVFSWLHHLWDDIKRAAVSVEKLVLSVAQDVALGIQYIEDGVRRVFRTIIHAVEDAVAAIGSFFVKLGKLIKNIVEALSLIFHLNEIIKTKNKLDE
ncbi:MAG TPA: PQQ-binding-like beta-propeller repeat protein, partial [Chloroflexota bacterium]|nr:PQQ-binding-like beta-propeller repeat protein [Chloroflexota bacterium]